MSIPRARPRRLLYAAVSVIALVAASAEVRGSDRAAAMAAAAPAPRPADPGLCAWWGEGGPQAIAGGDPHFGSSAVDSKLPRSAWEAAVGFDCRPAYSPWIIGAQVRYGTARNAANFTPRGTFAVRAGNANPGTPSILLPFTTLGNG